MMDGMPLVVMLPTPASLSTSVFLLQAKQPHGKMYGCSILHIFFFFFFFREREQAGGEGQRERERILSRLHAEHGA